MLRPIIETLNRLDAGMLMDDATEKLAEVVKSVEETGKAGELTIKVKVRKATAGALALEGVVTSKMPPKEKFESLLFATPEGNLLAEDPRQQRLELRQVETSIPTGALKALAV